VSRIFLSLQNDLHFTSKQFPMIPLLPMCLVPRSTV
jgi:hypothetical protein